MKGMLFLASAVLLMLVVGLPVVLRMSAHAPTPTLVPASAPALSGNGEARIQPPSAQGAVGYDRQQLSSARNEPEHPSANELPASVPEYAYAALYERAGDNPDAVEEYNYVLGMYASVDRCVAGSIHADTWIYYTITWDIDDDGWGHDPTLEMSGTLPAVGWTSAERNTFIGCVEDYLAAHPTTFLPSRAGRHRYGTMQTKFPLSTMPIYQFLREQRARRLGQP